MLTVVPTPIGNLKDITLRALEVLQTVDGIICEDSRKTQILLSHYQIKKPLLVLNDFNENFEHPKIVDKLKSGQNLALVSDAGSPLIADPGYKLIRSCLENEIIVDALPGPNSIIPALTLSGLPPDKFMFLGYLPEKSGQRALILENLKKISNIIKTTFIVFIAPHKAVKTLTEMKAHYGDLEVVLAKELTKIHQNSKKDQLSTWLDFFKKNNPKGEYVLLFSLPN